MASIADPRSSQDFKPRFELWMNVFLHQALTNVINSLTSLEITTRTLPGTGMMISEARVPLDRLVWNVKILRAMITDGWREADKVADFEAMTKGVNIEKDPDEYFHRILALLDKRGMLRYRQGRSLGGPRPE